MGKTFKIAVFDGDGIGPEITDPTLALLAKLTQSRGYGFDFELLPAGAQCYAETGTALPETSLAKARASDAILLSAMGLPHIRYPDGTEITPQIDIRIALGLYAGVRPVRIVPGQPSPLKIAAHEALDFVLIRESTEGLFHSKGAGEVTRDDAKETLRISRATSEKLFHFAFKLAERRKAAGVGPGRVMCVDKANVFRAFAFFRQIFDETAAQYPALTADHGYVDAVALWMVDQPQRFDVMVTENMFGDILSDLGAGLMGGLGLAPSADIGDDHAVFQPCHGTAPDIAAKGLANPMAMILSAAMMLEWLGQTHAAPEAIEDARHLQKAVDQVISERRVLTRDLGGVATTREVVTAVETAL
ncbi:MAG: isocitrate/isopropylmalate family dehydrogenase [Pseudomonadota bacterium]